MKHGRPQAKDIPDLDLLRAVNAINLERFGWAFFRELAAAIGAPRRERASPSQRRDRHLDRRGARGKP